MSTSAGRGKRTAAVQKECKFCHQSFNAKGLGSHEKACRVVFDAVQQDIDQHGSQHTSASMTRRLSFTVLIRISTAITPLANAGGLDLTFGVGELGRFSEYGKYALPRLIYFHSYDTLQIQCLSIHHLHH
jgi:hypothetical protein